MSIPVIVLTSGGLDSAVCLAYYLSRNMQTSALWVDYGQAAAKPEKRFARSLAKQLAVPIRELTIKGIAWPELEISTMFEFRGRNLTLATLALNCTPETGALVALAIHSGTQFADCTPAFAEQTDSLLALLSDGLVRLDCPFLSWTKAEVVNLAFKLNVPIESTYSCERAGPKPCMECPKCQERTAVLEDL